MKRSTKLSTGIRVLRGAWFGLLLAATTGLAAVTAADAGLAARAEAGDPWAQLNLGAAYDNGLAGYPLDPVRAVAWYRAAAEAGLAEAQFNLAHCLVTGNGVQRNDSEGLRWMLRAAQQGLASAQFLAGVMFAEGVGTTIDREQALVWLQRAADGGNLDAAALLAKMRATDGA